MAVRRTVAQWYAAVGQGQLCTQVQLSAYTGGVGCGSSTMCPRTVPRAAGSAGVVANESTVSASRSSRVFRMVPPFGSAVAPCGCGLTPRCRRVAGWARYEVVQALLITQLSFFV